MAMMLTWPSPLVRSKLMSRAVSRRGLCRQSPDLEEPLPYKFKAVLCRFTMASHRTPLLGRTAKGRGS